MLSYCLKRPDDSKPWDYADRWKAVSLTCYSRIERIMVGWAWSPVVYNKGYRAERNFAGAVFCVLDFDDGGLTLEEAINQKFADYKHIIGTTRSHRKDKHGKTCDRFRVLLEFEKPIIDLHTYKGNMAEILSEYEDYGIDESAKDGARFFWPCTKIASLNDDEGSFKVPVKAVAKKNHESNLIDYKRYAKLGVFPPFVRRNLANPIPKGRRDNTIYGLAKDLAKCGYPLSLIIQEVQKSPTYATADESHKRRFERACRSGFESGQKERPSSP